MRRFGATARPIATFPSNTRHSPIRRSTWPWWRPARASAIRYHIGIVCSVGSFYVGQERPVTGGFWQSGVDGLIDDLRKAGVACLEMECSALFVLARLFGMRSGAVLGAVANRVTNAFGDNGAEERAIRAANEAVVILDDWGTAQDCGRQGHLLPFAAPKRLSPEGHEAARLGTTARQPRTG